MSITCCRFELSVLLRCKTPHPLEDLFKERFKRSSFGSFTVYFSFHKDGDKPALALADVQLALNVFSLLLS